MLHQTNAVLELTGFKRSKFDQWVNKRIIIPAKPSKRKGERIGFSYENLVEILIVDRLIDCGIHMMDAGELARGVTKEWNNPESNLGEDLKAEYDAYQSTPEFYLLINVDDHSKYQVSLHSFPPYQATITVELMNYFIKVGEFLKDRDK